MHTIVLGNILLHLLKCNCYKEKWYVKFTATHNCFYENFSKFLITMPLKKLRILNYF